MAAKSKRTVMHSAKGKKLYAVRDESGQFKDIQQYSRAHAQDIKRSSSAEQTKKARPPATPAGKASAKAGRKKASTATASKTKARKISTPAAKDTAAGASTLSKVMRGARNAASAVERAVKRTVRRVTKGR